MCFYLQLASPRRIQKCRHAVGFQWFSRRFNCGWAPGWSWGGALSVIKHERQIIQCPMRTYGLVTPGGLPGGPLMPHGRSDKSSNVASAQVFVLLQLKLGGR